MLRGAFPTDIDGHPIVTEHDVIKAVQTAREQYKQSIMCKFSIINRIAIYPQQGVPILYKDQLNIIATHIAEIKDNIEEQGVRHQKYLNDITPSIATMKSSKKKVKLTRRLLKVQRD